MCSHAPAADAMALIKKYSATGNQMTVIVTGLMWVKNSRKLDWNRRTGSGLWLISRWAILFAPFLGFADI
jgi:hypothetical protein